MCINEVGRFEMVKELFWMPSTLCGPLNWEASRPGTVTILQFQFYLFILFAPLWRKMSDEDATSLNPTILAETNLLSFRNVFLLKGHAKVRKQKKILALVARWRWAIFINSSVKVWMLRLKTNSFKEMLRFLSIYGFH